MQVIPAHTSRHLMKRLAVKPYIHYHHHGDHTEGLEALATSTGAHVYGPSGDNPGHAHIMTQLSEGDEIAFDEQIKVLHTPGHTLDMLNFYLPTESVCFTGNTRYSR